MTPGRRLTLMLADRCNSGIALVLAFSVVTGLIGLSLTGYRDYYSDDLAGHVALVVRLAEVGGPWFYDRAWFGGFPAFEFYGFMPHWLASAFVDPGPLAWVEATRAVHGIMGVSVALLPLALWWMVTGWCEARTDRALLAGGVALIVALWLTVQDPEVPAGLYYLVSAGVFGQLPGWLVAFAYLGFLGRLGAAPSWQPLIPAALFSLVLATHTLTGVAVLLVGILMLVAHRGIRAAVRHALLALGLAAWFLAPYLAWSAEYTAGTPMPSLVGPLAMLFDQTLGLANGQAFAPLLILLELLLGITLVLGAGLALFSASPPARSALLLLLAAALLSGKVPADAFGPGLHYDRIVFVLAICSATMAAAAVARHWADSAPSSVWLAGGGMATVLAAVILVQDFSERPFLSSATPDGYAPERVLLGLLSSLSAENRLLFEYPVRLRGRPPGKFVEARTWSLNRQEIGNGLLHQSAPNQDLYVGALTAFRGYSSGPFPLAAESTTLDDREALDLLRRQSITHIVSASPAMAAELKRLQGTTRLAAVDRYEIHAINGAQPRVRAVDVPVLGYVDLVGDLPFDYFDRYVETRHGLSGQIRLVALSHEMLASAAVDGVVMNVSDPPAELTWRWLEEQGKRIPVLAFSYHTRQRSPFSSRVAAREHYDFKIAAGRLSELGVDRMLYAFEPPDGRPAQPEAHAAPTLLWAPDGRSIQFDGLHADRWYEVAYSYFPTWRADQSTVLRGSAGHMMIRPQSSSVTLRNCRGCSGPVRAGWLSTLVVLGFAVLLLRRGSRRSRMR